MDYHFSLNSSDLYFKIFQNIINVTAILTFIVAICAALIIYQKTSKFMASYGRLLLLYVSLTAIFSIYLFFFKVTYLLPYPMIITISLFSPISSTTTFLCFAFELFYTLISADLLLCMFIERYYSMTRGVTTHKAWSQGVIYFGIFFTNLTYAVCYFITHFYFGQLLPEKDTVDFVVKHYNASEDILAMQIPAITKIYDFSSYPSKIANFLLLQIGFTRSIGYIYYTRKNIDCLKILKASANPTVRRHNANAVKNLLTQLIILLIMGIVPAFATLFLVVSERVTFEVYLYVHSILHFYPIVDISCTLMIIRPYRYTLIKAVSSVFNFSFRPALNKVSPEVTSPISTL